MPLHRRGAACARPCSWGRRAARMARAAVGAGRDSWRRHGAERDQEVGEGGDRGGGRGGRGRRRECEEDEKGDADVDLGQIGRRAVAARRVSWLRAAGMEEAGTARPGRRRRARGAWSSTLFLGRHQMHELGEDGKGMVVFLDIDYCLRCAVYGENEGLEVVLDFGWCRSLLVPHDLNFRKGNSLSVAHESAFTECPTNNVFAERFDCPIVYSSEF